MSQGVSIVHMPNYDGIRYHSNLAMGSIEADRGR